MPSATTRSRSIAYFAIGKRCPSGSGKLYFALDQACRGTARSVTGAAQPPRFAELDHERHALAGCAARRHQLHRRACARTAHQNTRYKSFTGLPSNSTMTSPGLDAADVGRASGADASELEPGRVAAGHVGNRAEIDVGPLARRIDRRRRATAHVTSVAPVGRRSSRATRSATATTRASPAALILSGVSLAR